MIIRVRSYLLPLLLPSILAAATPSLAAEPPAAPAVLRDLAFFTGVWSCQARTPAGPMGPAQQFASTVTTKADLGNHFARVDYKEELSATHKAPVTAAEYWGYDGASKAFSRSGFDSTGGLYRFNSAGWEGDRWLWQGEAVLQGKRLLMRETTLRKGSAQSHTTSEIQIPGVGWVVIAETDCRRSS